MGSALRLPRFAFERRANVRLVVDRDHYDSIVVHAIQHARTSVWIATANVKEMRVEAAVGTRARARGQFASILDTFEGLAGCGVEIRLLHAGRPSRAFRAELTRRPRLRGELRFELRQCPRVHIKMIAVDGSFLYLGSANFTGAGLGAKGEGRRNFEMGIATDDELLLDVAQERYQRIWSGAECGACRLRDACPRPLDIKRPR